MTEKATELFRRVYEEIDSFVPPMAWASTVGIAIVYGKEVHQFATGTLLKVADENFLVTAAHVIDQARRQDKSLCVAAGHAFVPIYGAWACSRQESPFDVALLRMPPPMAGQLKQVSYVRLRDVDFTDLSTGIFCLTGYPGLLSRPTTSTEITMIVKPFQYVTYAYKGETTALDGYQDRYHLLLSADYATDVEGRPTALYDRSGHPLQFPRELGGISGCSVWRIGYRDRPLSEWKRYRPRIVAVQTGVYPRASVIKASRWLGVSSLLYEACPDLRPCLSLWYDEA